MKKILLLLAAIVVSGSVSAQGISYQGEVNLGYSIGLDYLGTDRIPVHIVNGARFNDYLFVGIGVGIEYHCYYEKFMERSTYTVPLFLNIKGYLPVGRVVSPFVGFDFGYNVGVGEYRGLGGLMYTPQIGVSFKVAGRSAINVSVGYSYQKMGQMTIYDKGADNILSLKLGYQF